MQQKLQGKVLWIFSFVQRKLPRQRKDQFDQTRLIMGIHPEKLRVPSERRGNLLSTGSYDGIQGRWF